MPTNKPEVVLPELPSCHTFQHPERLYTADQLRAYGQACIDTLTRPAAGEFVMVPREATQTIRSAIYMALHYDMSVQNPDEWAAVDRAYAAIISAAPQQPVEVVAAIPSASTIASAIWRDWMTNEQADKLGADLHRWLLAHVTTPPPAIDIGKLRELVKEWNALGIQLNGGEDKPYTSDENSVRALMLGRCADELAALIGDGGEKANGR